MPPRKNPESTARYTEAKKAPYLLELAKEREFRKNFELENGKFLRTGAVAEILDIEPEVIRDLIRKGELYAIKIGKSYRVTEADLQEFLFQRYTRRRSGDQKREDE